MKKNYYMHPVVNGTRFTVCGIYNAETADMKIGIARCSGKDQFNKKIGRMISEGRANKSASHAFQIHPESSLGKVFVEESLNFLKNGV